MTSEPLPRVSDRRALSRGLPVTLWSRILSREARRAAAVGYPTLRGETHARAANELDLSATSYILTPHEPLVKKRHLADEVVSLPQAVEIAQGVEMMEDRE
jgi:hypothetical protein